MTEVFIAIASDGHTLGFNIILGAIASIWLGILIGIIVYSKKEYDIFHKQKDLIMQANGR